MAASFSVLVADDDADVRVLLRTALRRDGRFTVVAEAADGAAAVEAAREHAPDLVLLDLAMPGLGGLEAIPLVRAASPGSRIVVVSGFPGDRLESVTTSRGAVGYVEKGLSPKQTVRDVLAVAGILESIATALSASATFERDLISSRAARRFVTETLSVWEVGDLLDNVNLLVTELVTNAIVHADSEAEVAVVLTPTRLRVEVGDQGDALPARREAEDYDTSGRGMALVETLAADWGIDPQPGGGKVIWFELDRPDV